MADKQQKYSIVLDGVNKLSAPLASAGNALNKLESDAAGTNNQLKKLDTQQKDIGNYQLAQATLKETRHEMSKLSLASDDLTKELIQSTLSLKDQEQELDAARGHLSRLKSEMNLSEKVSKEQRAEFKAQEKQVRDLKKSYSAQEKQVNTLTNAQRRNERQVEKTSAKFSGQTAVAGRLKHSLDSVGINTKDLGGEQLKLAKKTDIATQALSKQKASLKELRAIDARKGVRSTERSKLAGQATATAVAAMPLVGAGSRAVDYQSAFLDVKKVVNFGSQEEEDSFKSDMKRLAVDTGMSQIGMAEIVASAGKSGIGGDKNKTAQENQSDLLKFAREASEMSVAFGIDAAKSGETLATFQASMGLKDDKALSLAKTANLLADNLANTDPKQIAAVLAREGATAMSSGLSATDTAALAGSLFAADGSEDRSATALKSITGTLTKGFAATGSQKEIYAMLGLDADAIAAGMQSDSGGTIVEVFSALRDADDVDRSAMISQLFGEEAKGAVTKLIASMNGDKGLIATMKLAKDSAKASAEWEKELAGRRGSAQFLIDQSVTSLDRVVTALGDGLIPVIEVVAPMVTTVAENFAEMLEETPELATGLAIATTGLIAFKTAAIGLKLGKNMLGAGKDLISQKKLSSSVLSTSSAANNASRSIDRLNGKLNSLGDGASSGRGGRSSKRRRKSSRLGSLGKSKWAKRAGFLGGAAALTLMPGAANAAESLTLGGDLVDGMGAVGELSSKGGALAGAGGLVGKMAKPLGIVVSSIELVDSINNGSAEDVGSAAGDLTGGIGGAMAGAALGSLILPGIGTAIGGALGGIGGGAAGSWLGEQIAGWFSSPEGGKNNLPINRTDELVPPGEQTQLQRMAVAKTPPQDNRQIQIKVEVTPTGNLEYDRKMGEEVAQKTALAFNNVAPPDFELAIANTLGDVS